MQSTNGFDRGFWHSTLKQTKQPVTEIRGSCWFPMELWLSLYDKSPTNRSSQLYNELSSKMSYLHNMLPVQCSWMSRRTIQVLYCSKWWSLPMAVWNLCCATATLLRPKHWFQSETHALFRGRDTALYRDPDKGRPKRTKAEKANKVQRRGQGIRWSACFFLREKPQGNRSTPEEICF